MIISELKKRFDGKNTVEEKYSVLTQVCTLLLQANGLQKAYIKELAKYTGLPTSVFTDTIKEIENLNASNDPQVERLEAFIKTNYEIRNNIISNKFEYKKITDDIYTELNEYNILRHLRKNHFRIKIQELIETLKSDFTPIYNPFENYFTNTNLDLNDDFDYINKLSSYISLHDESERVFFETMFKKALIRTIACCLGNTFNKQCFTLVGEGINNQNMGKTSFIRFLCPPELSQYYTEELTIDKDGFIALAENFIINLDELSTLQKAEINQLKTFMSKDVVKVRLPYERRASTIKRRASFFASTNEANFLTDLTGNVRWIAFKIVKINFDYSKEVDINKVWAYAYKLFKEGYNYNLTVDEIKHNEKRNNNFIIMPAEMELIPKFFENAEKGETEDVYFMQTSDILKFLSLITNHVHKFNINAVGRALRKLGFEKVQHYIKENNYNVYGYYVKLIDYTKAELLTEYKISKY